LRLTELLAADHGGPDLRPGSDPDIVGLTADSRAVRRGFLFAALPGEKKDGRRFISQAIASGAAAILAPAGTQPEPEWQRAGVPLVTDDNPRRRLALLAARLYGRQPRIVAAVTGTNGKTSTAVFTRQIWSQLGEHAASLGTIGLVADGKTRKPTLTTPDPVALHADLADLADQGITHLAFEASSHGLAQYRLDGVKIAAAAFTNLTRDHFDYHRTLEAYRAAKLRLFDTLLPAGKPAVVNADAQDFAPFAEAARARGCPVIDFGRNGREIRLVKAAPTETGRRIEIKAFGKTHKLVLPLAGAFQTANALCALGLAVGSGAPADGAVAALSCLEGVPGRMQLAAHTPAGAPVYVDYAHTPDALANVLNALRPHTKGRLAVVFGCGGDRDPGKRPLMGRIADGLADDIYVTDDNPRSENPAAIRAAVMAACPRAKEVGDRAEAIRIAAAALGRRDALVIAGKGHESGQIVGDVVRPFDDVEVARAAVAALAGESR
jgi:UDP-N-acetylmuramoyl-L-alanyl-D-glutamate--2,6-diaminopimelate ligase